MKLKKKRQRAAEGLRLRPRRTKGLRLVKPELDEGDLQTFYLPPLPRKCRLRNLNAERFYSVLVGTPAGTKMRVFPGHTLINSWKDLHLIVVDPELPGPAPDEERRVLKKNRWVRVVLPDSFVFTAQPLHPKYRHMGLNEINEKMGW